MRAGRAVRAVGAERTAGAVWVVVVLVVKTVGAERAEWLVKAGQFVRADWRRGWGRDLCVHACCCPFPLAHC